MTPSAQYSRMPGGGIARRPLHLIILADCSGGMKGEKIQALNYAIADMLPHLEEWEQDQEQAQVFVAGDRVRDRAALAHRAADAGRPASGGSHCRRCPRG